MISFVIAVCSFLFPSFHFPLGEGGVDVGVKGLVAEEAVGFGGEFAARQHGEAFVGFDEDGPLNAELRLQNAD